MYIYIFSNRVLSNLRSSVYLNHRSLTAEVSWSREMEISAVKEFPVSKCLEILNL